MNRNVAVALLAGLLGGMLTHYIAPPAVFAQNQTPAAPPMEIRAQNFTLVDQSNQTLGTFSAETVPGAGGTIVRSPGQPPQVQRRMSARIVLRDANGIELWSAGGNAVRPISQK